MKRVIIIVEMCFSKTYIANILLCWLIRLKPQVSPTSTGSSSSWGKMEAVPWWVNKRMCCEAAAGFLHTADGVLVSHLTETWRTPDHVWDSGLWMRRLEKQLCLSVFDQSHHKFTNFWLSSAHSRFPFQCETSWRREEWRWLHLSGTQQRRSLWTVVLTDELYCMYFLTYHSKQPLY